MTDFINYYFDHYFWPIAIGLVILVFVALYMISRESCNGYELVIAKYPRAMVYEVIPPNGARRFRRRWAVFLNVPTPPLNHTVFAEGRSPRAAWRNACKRIEREG